MRGDGLIDFLPLWGVFLATLLLVLLCVEVGYRLGQLRRQRSEREKEAPVGGMVAALLGLVALMLAFTFGLAGARFDARRQVVLDEANAIGTTYLRAAMLPEPHQARLRTLLREYVDVRVNAVLSPTADVRQAVRRSEQLHNLLWAEAVAAANQSPNSIIAGLFVQSLNEVIDLHSKRVTVGLRSRIPASIWIGMYGISVLALLSLGYHSGLAGTSRSAAILAVAIALSTVVWLIADLDRPREGSLRVGQQAMIDLQKSIAEPGS
jgi:hypothetical protein